MGFWLLAREGNDDGRYEVGVSFVYYTAQLMC